MATLTRTTAPAVGATFVGAAGGTAVGYTNATSGGTDLIPISSGRGTLFLVRTAAQAVNVILNSVLLSQYGGDQDITMTMSATDDQHIFLINDGLSRFDQGGGSPQLMSVSYSTTFAGGTVKIAAVTIP